jgi:hypothetical protein
MANAFTIGIIAGVFGGIIGGLAVLLIALLKPAPNCPECGQIMPKTRKPANLRQTLWGGWTCPNCGCEMDRRGRRVELQ